MGEVLQSASHEARLVQNVFGIDPNNLGESDLEEFNHLVAIVGQFSRVNPETGDYESISPSRVQSIPAITARHIKLVAPARGILSPQEIAEVWRANMPFNNGERHPDLLFDIAQYNFGTDEPIDDILRAINRAEIRRQELIAAYKSEFRHRATAYRYDRPLDDDTPEEAVDAWADAMTGRG